MSNIDYIECPACCGRGWEYGTEFYANTCFLCSGTGELPIFKYESKKSEKPRIIDSLKEFKSFIDAVKYGKYRYISCGIKGEE